MVGAKSVGWAARKASLPFGDFESCEGGEGVEALMVHCGAEVSVLVLELMRIAWFRVGLWRYEV